jgi:hypothetical protein
MAKSGNERPECTAQARLDPDWDGMWRVRMPNGNVSDMVNLTRAKDAAQSIALASLNAASPGRAA